MMSSRCLATVSASATSDRPSASATWEKKSAVVAAAVMMKRVVLSMGAPGIGPGFFSGLIRWREMARN